MRKGRAWAASTSKAPHVVGLRLGMTYGPYGWNQFDEPTSRFTEQPVFIVRPDVVDDDRVTDEEVERVVAEAKGTDDVVIRPFGASFGRGASGSAIGLLVDLGVNLGAAGLAGAVVAVWKRIRHRRPIMSVGALRYRLGASHAVSNAARPALAPAVRAPPRTTPPTS